MDPATKHAHKHILQHKSTGLQHEKVDENHSPVDIFQKQEKKR